MQRGAGGRGRLAVEGGEEGEDGGFVAAKLGLKLGQVLEFLFSADTGEYFNGEGGTVKIAVEVEDVDFAGEYALVADGGADADVEHAGVGFVAEVDAHGVDTDGRK